MYHRISLASLVEGCLARASEMSYQDEPISHAVNNDWGWWRSQDYDSVVNCGRLAIRHGQAKKTSRQWKFQSRIKLERDRVRTLHRIG
jgi:hypothetical protein